MKKIYLCLLMVATFTACDLDREPYGISNYWNTQEDVQMALDAAYEPLYQEDGFGRGQWWQGPASDDMVTNRSINEIISMTNFTADGMVNTSSNIYDNWQFMYRVIRRCNDVMKHAPAIEMPQADRDVMLGEANFLCAFSYFFLAKRYGGLPFYDYNHPEETNKPRETKTETFRRIVAYLEESAKHFEAQSLWTRTDDATGRPTLGATYGLLAKVYAYWGKYDLCKTYTQKVITSGRYSLDKTGNNGFAHLFSPAGESHEEVLFNLVCNPVRHQGTVTSVILLSFSLSNGAGWSYFAPTRSLYNAFEAGDLRRQVTMVGPGDEVGYLGQKMTLTSNMIADMSTGFMCAKYAKAYDNLTEWKWETGADIPLLRYADVLLLDAEADIFLAGGGADNRTLGVPAAATSFNEVHLRAFGGDESRRIAAPTFNDLVRERRCELAYEDDRHFDLVRWGLAQEVYAAATTDIDPRGPRTFDPVKNAHFPLPQKEIENSDYKLINNPKPGYSTFGE